MIYKLEKLIRFGQFGGYSSSRIRSNNIIPMQKNVNNTNKSYTQCNITLMRNASKISLFFFCGYVDFFHSRMFALLSHHWNGLEFSDFFTKRMFVAYRAVASQAIQRVDMRVLQLHEALLLWPERPREFDDDDDVDVDVNGVKPLLLLQLIDACN